MFSRELFERMVRAFLAASLATFAAGVATADVSLPVTKAILVGAIASGVSACLSVVATFVGDPDSTSFVK